MVPSVVAGNIIKAKKRRLANSAVVKPPSLKWREEVTVVESKGYG